MQNKTVIATSLVAALALVAGILLTAEGFAQPEAADPNEPVEEETPQEPVTAAGSGPLEDYESSEQISEDLSVSFPIDI